MGVGNYTYEAHISKFGKSFRAQFSWILKIFFRIAKLYYIAACFYFNDTKYTFLVILNNYRLTPVGSCS